MKILIASDMFHPTINGVATFSRNLARGLAAHGHEVMVLAPSTARRSHTEHEDGYTIRRLWSVPLRLYPLRVVLRPGDEIKTCFDLFQPDVVHIQSPLEIGRNSILEARRRGIPVVATNHAMPDNVVDNLKVLLPVKYPFDRIMRLYGSYLHNKANIVTMPTQSAVDVLSLRFNPTCEVVSNGVDTVRFHPGPASIALRQRYHLPEDIPIVMYVGRLDGEKHLDVFVRALAIMQSDRPVHGLIVGKGTVRLQLEELARQLDIGDRLSFTGFASDATLPDLYRLGTLFAISSPAELQSIATLEAVASGLPVVAANAAALPELCQPDINGLLFKTDNPEAMAQAVLDLLGHPRTLARMGRASRQIGLKHSFEKTLKSFERIYKNQVAAVEATTVSVSR